MRHDNQPGRPALELSPNAGPTYTTKQPLNETNTAMLQKVADSDGYSTYQDDEEYAHRDKNRTALRALTSKHLIEAVGLKKMPHCRNVTPVYVVTPLGIERLG